MLIQTPRNPSVIRQLGPYPRALNMLSRKQTALQRQLRRDGLAGYEPLTQATLLTLVQLVPRPAEFFDIGARIGLYSALISAVYGPAAVRVTAFEPTPGMADICARIAEANGLALNLERSVVSDRDGRTTLFLSDEAESPNSREVGVKPGSPSMTVPATRLDSYCERTNRAPNVMKIDIEAHDVGALSAAIAIIERARPWILCGFRQTADPDHTAALLRDLTALDYRIHRWLGGRWRESSVTDRHDHTTDHNRNLLLTPESLPTTFQPALSAWLASIAVCTAATNKLVPAGQQLPTAWNSPHPDAGAATVTPRSEPAGVLAKNSRPHGPRNQLLLVAGPGRSGTSLVTGIIRRLGYYVPQPELGSDETNPRGFSEPRWALSFHKRLMKHAGIEHGDTRPDALERGAREAQRASPQDDLRRWLDDQFQKASNVVVKDPRSIWFIDLYIRICQSLDIDLAVITMLRHPAESIRSNITAYGANLTTAARTASWINGYLSIERATRDLPRAMIPYDDLLTNWRTSLETAEARISASLLREADEAQLRSASELVDPALARSTGGWDDLHPGQTLRHLADFTFDALLDLSAISLPVPSTAHREIDELAKSYTDLYQLSRSIVRSSINEARRSERSKVQRELREAKALARQAPAIPATSTGPARPTTTFHLRAAATTVLGHLRRRNPQ